MQLTYGALRWRRVAPLALWGGGWWCWWRGHVDVSSWWNFCAFRNRGGCDSMCMDPELLLGEVIAYWPFCGDKVGEQWCLLQKGSVGTKRPGWGWGLKDEGNVLEPNNQHVDVFTSWPSSRVAVERSRFPGLRVPLEPEKLSDWGWMSFNH